MATERTDEPGRLETDEVTVRTMQSEDLKAVVEIDAGSSGRRRPQYFELMIERALKQSKLQVSLVAELDGRVVGFLIGSLYYGEFGVVEPSASIEAISVSPDFRGRHVGRALLRQLRLNLGALRITTLRTVVSWDDFDLLAFFKHEGFRLSSHLLLEAPLDPTTL